MDKTTMAQRFAKAMNTYNQEAEVQRGIAQKMIRLCKTYVMKPCNSITDIGCGTGVFSEMLAAEFQPGSLLLNDICSEMQECCSDLLNKPGVRFLPGDAEKITFPQGQQLITSCSAVQWFQNPETFFLKVKNSLCDRGIFAFSTFGPDNLNEVRSITRQGLAYITQEQLNEMLSEHFNILYCEEETIVRWFSDPAAVLRHMKNTGVSGLSGPAWTRGKLNEFCNSYTAAFAHENKVPLTYHPVYIVAQKK